jgi:hypothetical protein
MLCRRCSPVVIKTVKVKDFSVISVLHLRYFCQSDLYSTFSRREISMVVNVFRAGKYLPPTGAGSRTD